MKLIIDIYDDAYNYCKSIKDDDLDDLGFFTSHILKSVANGIPFDSFPNREKGEWIPMHPLQANDGGAYVCSKCHSGDYGCERDAFCRWCGADMRGKDNE